MDSRSVTTRKRKREILYELPSAPSDPEVKMNDIQFSTRVGTGYYSNYQCLYHLNGLGIGTSGNQRVGRVVHPRAIWLNFIAYKHAYAGAVEPSSIYCPRFTTYKLSLVWDKRPNGAPIGGVSADNNWIFINADVYKNQNGYPTNIIANPNVDYRDRIEVLWEDVVQLSAIEGKMEGWTQARIDLSHLKQVFNGQNLVTIADIVQGALYLCVQVSRTDTSDTTRQDQIDIAARYFFNDA